MTFIVAQKYGPHGLLLVITDRDILGKTFQNEKARLDLSTRFYQGVEMEKSAVLELLARARDVHLTGKEAVALAVELDLADGTRILWVEGVPHVQLALLG